MPNGEKQSGGVLPRNSRQGFRSETLARFALSAFGPATDVEVEDDQGIDLICATSRPVGGRLHVGPGYSVQVKSEGETEVVYQGPHVRTWLEGLASPLFICLVDKGTTRIRLYSTWSITRVLLHATAYGGTIDRVRLVPDEPVTCDQPPPEHVTLGNPIIDFRVPELAEQGRVDRLRECIEQWVLMDVENIVRRRFDLAVASGYTEWTTNLPPKQGARWYKPYFPSEQTWPKARAIIAECASLLALRKDPQEKDLLAAFVKKYCDLDSMHEMMRGWLGV